MNIFRKSNNSTQNPPDLKTQDEAAQTAKPVDNLQKTKIKVKPVKGKGLTTGFLNAFRTTSRDRLDKNNDMPVAKKSKSFDSNFGKAGRKRSLLGKERVRPRTPDGTSTTTGSSSASGSTGDDKDELRRKLLRQAKREEEAALRLRDKINNKKVDKEKECAMSEKLQQRKKPDHKSDFVPVTPSALSTSTCPKMDPEEEKAKKEGQCTTKNGFRPVFVTPVKQPSTASAIGINPEVPKPKDKYGTLPTPYGHYGGVATAETAITVSSVGISWDEKTQAQTVTVTNRSDTRRACKFKCSDNRSYVVNPVYFLVEPKMTQIVTFTKTQQIIKMDKFVLYHCKTDKGSAQEAFDLFGHDERDEYTITITTVPSYLGHKN